MVVRNYDRRSTLSQKISTALSAIAILISCYALYLNIQDNKEVLSYSADKTTYSFMFNEDTFNENSRDFKNIDVYRKENFIIFNDSKFPVTIRSLDLYEEVNGERVLKNASPETEAFKGFKLEPGDYKIYSYDWIYSDTVNDDKIFEALKENVDSVDFQSSFNKIETNHSVRYYNFGLDQILLEEYGKYLKKTTYPKRVYKITTTRGTKIWIKLMYPDDFV